LESKWRQGVVDAGLSGLGASKAARILTSTHEVWVTDVPDPIFNWAFLCSAPYPPGMAGLPEYWQYGYAPKPAGDNSKFPYGYVVIADH
jgi:hypothetical protein